MGRTASFVVILAGAMAFTACAGTVPSTVPLAGWYSEHGASATLQPCGRNETWTIRDAGELSARARAFDLQSDTPVYVKLRAQVSVDPATQAHAISVIHVVQFGSPTPVRNCALNGVVTHSMPSSSSSR
jgi:hypothetical protein